MRNDDDAAVIAPRPSAVDSAQSPLAAGSIALARRPQDPRAAVREHEIVCLLCGAAFRQLTNTHLLAHGLSSIEYKRRFGYNLGRPLMCHALRGLYAERARDVRLAARIRRRPLLLDPELRRRGGAREIAVEETLTRRDVQRLPRRRWSVRDARGRFVSR